MGKEKNQAEVLVRMPPHPNLKKDKIIRYMHNGSHTIYRCIELDKWIKTRNAQIHGEKIFKKRLRCYRFFLKGAPRIMKAWHELIAEREKLRL